MMSASRMYLAVVVIAFVATATQAFAPSSPVSAAHRHVETLASFRSTQLFAEGSEEVDPMDTVSESHTSSTMTTAALTAAAAVLATPLGAVAASPDWGIFEGKTGSLLHPVMMGSLLLYSLYTAFLGFQWRRQRTMGDEIKALQKTMPPAPAEGESPSPSAMAIQRQIADLQDERKSIAAKGPRDQHFNQGALLVFLGTAFAIEGPLNTYARAGKLFPGPHLYVGASLVVLWALAAACIPAMQKGSDTARTIHIGANIAALSFFVWQVVSGIPILLKVWELTKWP